jgi:hypothetical protein
VNLNETLLQELSIVLLKNTRQIAFEGCSESSMFLLTMVALVAIAANHIKLMKLIEPSQACCN